MQSDQPQVRRPIPTKRMANNILGKVKNLPALPGEVYQMPTPKQFQNLTPAARSALMSRLPAAVNFAYSAHNMLPPKYQLSADNVMKAFKNVRGGAQRMDGDSNDGTANSSYGLSKAPNPKKVALNSGISPNTWSNDYMVPVEDLCASMHMSACTLQIPVDTTKQGLASYFINTLAFDIQTRAQSNVGFSLDVTNVFTASAIRDAMNAAIAGLQVYFYLSSILSYESDPRNKNAAMIQLRGLITSSILSDLTQLGRRLEDTPIPPRVVEWVRYMNMNFLAGDNQGAALLKIAPAYDFDSITTLASTALTNMNSAPNNAIYTLIRRSIPQWKVGTLFDVPAIPVFDKNFLTIFTNLPSSYFNTSSVMVRYPNASTSTGTVSYNTFNNKLDGAAYCMTSIYQNTVWSPGLVAPVAATSGTTGPSRKSYYNQGTTYRWYEVPNIPFLVYSRGESYSSNNGGSTYSPHLFGAEKCQGVSVDSLNQTGQNFLDFLFNVNSIPVKGKLSNFSNNGTNNV